MPTSNWYLLPEVVAMVNQVPHRSVVDVGPGHGKYAVALRELCDPPPERIDCIEAHGPYIDDFGLDRLYDRVIHADATLLPPGAFDGYDVVLIVDCIEHMDHADALALLARIPGRVVLCTPEEWFSNGPGLPESETHRSHWTEEDWSLLAKSRPLEVAYLSLGGWLVRLGPL